MAFPKTLTFTAILLLSVPIARALRHSKTSVSQHYEQRNLPRPREPEAEASPGGDWAGAKAALRSPERCVVSVAGLEPHFHALRTAFVDGGPCDLDLRFRVRVPLRSWDLGDDDGSSDTRDDCLRLRRAVVGSSTGNGEDSDDRIEADGDDLVTDSLVELARGVASLADGPLETSCDGVFVRVVCASDYRARNPMFHTDKAPLRAYVTLRGVGTEFMTRACTLAEYATLRTGTGGGDLSRSIREAEELEFIVMKGDGYECDPTATTKNINPAASWMKRAWKRTEACVHRSPPGAMAGGRRVILSVDLADGDDDREWYQAGAKREWRSGMTQRKSRLVA